MFPPPPLHCNSSPPRLPWQNHWSVLLHLMWYSQSLFPPRIMFFASRTLHSIFSLYRVLLTSDLLECPWVSPWTSSFLCIYYTHYLVNSIFLVITPKFLAWVSLDHQPHPSTCLFERPLQLNSRPVPFPKVFLQPSNGNSILHLFKPKILIFCDFLLSLTNHFLSLSKDC